MKKQIPILLLAAFLAYSGLSGLWHFGFLRNAMLNMGIFSVWFRWYQLFMIPLNLIMAFGLWTRKEWGRIIAVIYFGLGLIKSVFSSATHIHMMRLMATTGGSLTGQAAPTMLFSNVIIFGSLFYSALLFTYLLQRQVRQYFQEGSLSTDSKSSSLVTAMGYTGVALFLGMTIFPYFWSRATGGPTVAESRHWLAGGKNQAAIISMMEKRVYPPLAELEKQAASTSGMPSANLLQRMAVSAYAEGQYDKARKYAEELLQTKSLSGIDGDAIHHGNIVLGRLALREGNWNEAKARLLAAGNTPGSPPLNSFGPNMALAEELLEKNEREVVLQYFDLCRRFWKLGNTQLDAWTATVQKDEIPAFMANLIY